jgi:hypothetical protein
MILFNSKSRDYGWLSNFHRCEVVYEGDIYPSVENAYQAAKTVIPAERAPFRVYVSWCAKACGQQVTMRPDWTDRFKLDLMRSLMEQKYSIPYLRILLLSTGAHTLEEDVPDPFWGRGRDGLGHNWCGRLQYQIRKTL